MVENEKNIRLKKPTLKAIHICNSLKATTPPKIAKEYGLPTLNSEPIRNVGKPSRTWEALCTTMYKKNRAKSA